MIAWLLGTWLGRALGAVCTAILALVGAWVAGRRTGRRAAETDRLRGDIVSLQTRERIDDAIDQDTDLVARARRAGLLRDDPHE